MCILSFRKYHTIANVSSSFSVVVCLEYINGKFSTSHALCSRPLPASCGKNNKVTRRLEGKNVFCLLLSFSLIAEKTPFAQHDLVSYFIKAKQTVDDTEVVP